MSENKTLTVFSFSDRIFLKSQKFRIDVFAIETFHQYQRGTLMHLLKFDFSSFPDFDFSKKGVLYIILRFYPI